MKVLYLDNQTILQSPSFLRDQKVGKKSFASDAKATTLILGISRNPSRSEAWNFTKLITAARSELVDCLQEPSHKMLQKEL